MPRLLGLIDPRVADRLVPDEGEFVVDEVRHHWVVYLPRGLEVLLAAGLLVVAAFVPIVIAFLPLVAAAVVLLHALARGLASWVDRFVITNLRVFRSWGLISRQLATMPIQRILDISVTKPPLGRVLDYGHFLFESAAQDQGLREIRFVGRPFDRDLTMQRVIQRAGLRRGMKPVPDSDDGDGSSLWGSEPAPADPPPGFRARSERRPEPGVDRPGVDRPVDNRWDDRWGDDRWGAGPPTRRPAPRGDPGPYRSRASRGGPPPDPPRPPPGRPDR